MDKKWYKNSLLIVAALILFFPVGLVLMWLFSTWSNKVKIGVTALFAVLIIIGASSGGSQPSTSTTKPADTTTQPTQQSTTQQVKLNYEILDKVENKVVENISVLVSKDETQGEAIAVEVKKTCKKQCNIDVWNSREVYTTYKEYQNLTSDSNTPLSKIEQYKKQNYVKWGDSLIGSISFETNTYNDFPLQDWYYKELKSK